MASQSETGPASRSDQDRDTSSLYLVDGSGFIFRAFHALPPLNRPDGTPVNAVYGFAAMLIKLLADMKAVSVAVLFDAARENFRNRIYEAYKANRPEPPEELVPQFPLIREATAAFNLPSIELEGYEADDLIATYARLAREAGRPVTIVSSDKDLMQLVADGVEMLDPIKYTSITPREVMEKFGVTPDKVVDVQALTGDSIDNVPGVPGIGVKTGAQLITQYGSLEALLDHLDDIKQPKRREKLKENAELASISKQLVKLDDQVPVPMPLDALTVHQPDVEKLVRFFQAQGFQSLIPRVRSAAAVAAQVPAETVGSKGASKSADQAVATTDSAAALETAQPPLMATRPPPPGKIAYECVQDIAVLDRWIALAQETGVVAVDTETDSLTPAKAKLVGLSLACLPGHACYVPLGHVQAQTSLIDDPETEGDSRQLATADVMARLKPLLQDPSVLKIGHNFKFDAQLFLAHGIRVNPVDDTMLISYVQDGSLHGHGMDELAELFLDYTPIKYKDVVGSGKSRITFDRVPIAKAVTYAAEDADITLRLHQLLKPRLVQAHLTTVYETIERPLIGVVADMEWAGVKVDKTVLVSLSREFSGRLDELEGEVHQLAGRRFNVGSTKQLGEVLFVEMGLTGGKKSKSGTYSTDSSVLEPLAEQGAEIAQKVLDWRQLSKLRSTYTDALQEDINPRTGRVHTSFSLAQTNTGRIASTDPNLQNIPIRTEEGRKIRAAFIAEGGFKLLSVDYSQIELRLVAEMAGIGALQDAFRDGIDIHALTASKVFGVPLKEMTSEIRRKAKAINFGIIYGISGYGLGRQLGIGPGEANAFIKDYLQRFHELKSWMDKTKTFCRQHGYVVTRFGRRCFIPSIKEKNPARRAFAERQAINAPIQGTAADIIKRAMARLPASLAASNLEARLLLQVHDELLFEVPESQIDETSAAVRQVMEGAATLSVPLVAEAGVGDTWADAH